MKTIRKGEVFRFKSYFTWSDRPRTKEEVIVTALKQGGNWVKILEVEYTGVVFLAE